MLEDTDSTKMANCSFFCIWPINITCHRPRCSV